MNSTPAAGPSFADFSTWSSELSPGVRAAGRRLLVRLIIGAALVALAFLVYFAGPELPAGLVDPLGLGEVGTAAVQALAVPMLFALAAAVVLASAVRTAVRAPGVTKAPAIVVRAAWHSSTALMAAALVLVVGASIAFVGLLGALMWSDSLWAISLVYGVPTLMVVGGLALVLRAVRIIHSRTTTPAPGRV